MFLRSYLHTLPDSILFMLCLNGVFQRLAMWVKALRLPPVHEDGWVWRDRHTELRTGKEEQMVLSERCDELSNRHKHIKTQTRVKSSRARVRSRAPFPLWSDAPAAVSQHHWSKQGWPQRPLTLALQLFSPSVTGVRGQGVTETERRPSGTWEGLTSPRGTKTWCRSSAASGSAMADLRRPWMNRKQG